MSRVYGLKVKHLSIIRRYLSTVFPSILCVSLLRIMIEFCILWKTQYGYPCMKFDSTCIIAHNDQRQPLKGVFWFQQLLQSVFQFPKLLYNFPRLPYCSFPQMFSPWVSRNFCTRWGHRTWHHKLEQMVPNCINSHQNVLHHNVLSFLRKIIEPSFIASA